MLSSFVGEYSYRERFSFVERFILEVPLSHLSFFFSFSFHFAVIQAIFRYLDSIFDDNFVDQWMRSVKVSLIHAKLKKGQIKMGG